MGRQTRDDGFRVVEAIGSEQAWFGPPKARSGVSKNGVSPPTRAVVGAVPRNSGTQMVQQAARTAHLRKTTRVVLDMQEIAQAIMRQPEASLRGGLCLNLTRPFSASQKFSPFVVRVPFWAVMTARESRTLRAGATSFSTGHDGDASVIRLADRRCAERLDAERRL